MAPQHRSCKVILLVLVLAVAFGLAIVPAVRADRADRSTEYHIFHGPASDCVECENK